MPRKPLKPSTPGTSKVSTPESLYELSGSPYPKFLIALTKEENPGSIKFKAWLQSNQSNITFPIYMVPSTSDPALTSALYRMVNVLGFPTFVVTDKSLKQIDAMTGFHEVALVSFLKKNFPEETSELH